MSSQGNKRQDHLAWQRYIDHEGIKFDQPSYIIDASKLKAITGYEPRLLAKFDTPDDLPPAFRTAGYTLLPVRNGRYVMVQGNIFISLPDCVSKRTFQPQLDFALVTALRARGESQYIDYAYNTGLLADFLGLNRMYMTIRGRERAKPFRFAISGQQIEVDGVQIEVDGGYEAKNDVILVEGKIGLPKWFNVRQIYYPYRHFSTIVPEKRIRNIFFAYEPATSTYHLFEFVFPQEADPVSARLAACCVYDIKLQLWPEVHKLLDVEFQTKNDLVPQADDLSKILRLLMLVENGINTSENVAAYLGFTPRQSSYYREASQYLGLLRLTSDNEFELTSQGVYLLSQRPDTQAHAFAKVVVNSWIFVELIKIARELGSFSEHDIDKLIASVRMADGSPRYNPTTIGRRRQTIRAWLKWLTEEIGCFERDGDRYGLR
jgi:hypothetical protein